MARVPRNPTTDYISVGSIAIDPLYQRAVESRWVRHLADNWDDNAVGLICVSLRADGLHYVIDGQHRHAAAQQLGLEYLPAEVWRNLSIPEEALMFLQRNEVRPVRRVDKFLAAVEAGSPDQCEILKLVEAAGWQISDESRDGNIRAVAALERIYGASSDASKERRPEALRVTLEIVRHAWGLDQDGTSGFLLDGLGKVVIRYGEQLDIESLIRKLSKYNGGPLALVGRSKELRSFINTTVPNCVAEMIVEVYNTGLRTTRLAAWRS